MLPRVPLPLPRSLSHGPRQPLSHRTAASLAWLLLLSFLLPSLALALGDAPRVAFSPAKDSLLLADQNTPVSLATSPEDWPGVLRASRDLSDDFARVLNAGKPMQATASGTATPAPATLIVGTLGRHPLIDALAREGRINASAIRGKWEAHLSQIVDNPAPGIARALVIAGSDKRGTIYGIYGLSEQIGVSPWYWWADVATTQRTAIHALPIAHVDAGPAVRYRGIFLNDEAPALTGWAREKFGGMNSKLYAHVFELILRLRGNYLWPAMWNNAFNEDDPQNPILADEYGIVMGTSHHEPMIRSQQEWKRHGSGHWDYNTNAKVLADFWTTGVRRNRNLESLVTLGMRGDGDEPMSEESNVALLQRIVADQRAILTREIGKPITEIPQLWALYKEVQDYYEKGMRVPDDVTLLWCDDNWGNVRRLPTAAERTRPGGAGVYYHFDYVGGPRNYKWINTNYIPKIWEQMHLAWEHGADRIWIVNVGDLKPMELPIDFFLSYAWNPEAWPLSRLPDFTRLWAAREFGPERADAIASLVDRTTRLNALVKPELLTPDTYSLVNYQEGERVLASWKTLRTESEQLLANLPPAMHDSYFQLVHHPLHAAGIVNELYLTAGLNRLYAAQGRRDTNDLAAKARALFAEDAALTARYHALGGGRWNHMMDQTHLGYTYWQQPPRNAMPAVTELQIPAEGSELGFALEGGTTTWPNDFVRPTLPPLEAWLKTPRYVEVFTRNAKPAAYSLSASVPWLRLSSTQGKADGTVRISVDADWDKVPEGDTNAHITVSGDGLWPHRIAVRVRNPKLKGNTGPGAFFVESDGVVAIEAAHATARVNSDNATWTELPAHGRTLSGMTTFPSNAPSVNPGKDTPHLQYQVHLWSAGEYSLEAHLSPTLAFRPHQGLRYAVSIDDAKPVIVDLATTVDSPVWSKSVTDSIRRSTTKLRVSAPGTHTLKFWLVDPGVVLQRLILTAPGATQRPSFFGPPETRLGGN